MTLQFAATTLLTTVLLTAQTKLLPVDESASDPQFAKFYQSFRAAVSAKDAKALIDIIDAEAEFDFGGGDKGPKAFEKLWNPADPNSKLWPELATLTTLGGSFSTEQGTKMFCGPYTYSKFPDAVDGFDHGVILRAGVEVRSRPSERAPVVAKLSHDIVRVPSWKPARDDTRSDIRWIHVVTKTAAGYVRSTDIRSPGDFRVCFSRKKGRWLLRYLIAGD